jgi:agmatinase
VKPRYGPADSLQTPRFSGVRTFARLPHVTQDLEHADAAIVGVPFDTGGTFRVGARFGPEAIRSASALLRPFHTGSSMPIFDLLSVIDYGDAAVVPGYFEQSAGLITERLLRLHRAGVVPIGLGGDHSVALPELRAAAAVHGPVGLVQLDSHSDTSEAYFGVPYTHGTPFFHAAREGLLDPARSIQVGLRGPVYSADDWEVPRRLGFEVIPATEAHELGMHRVAERIRARAGTEPVFLSFDIDFVDPAYAPATGTPEIGGFTSWDVQVLLRGLGGLDLVAGDVVEVIPDYDVAQCTALVAANVAYELLALLARARTPGR